jgi:hypothetical protein
VTYYDGFAIDTATAEVDFRSVKASVDIPGSVSSRCAPTCAEATSPPTSDCPQIHPLIFLHWQMGDAAVRHGRGPFAPAAARAVPSGHGAAQRREPVL